MIIKPGGIYRFELGDGEASYVFVVGRALGRWKGFRVSIVLEDAAQPLLLDDGDLSETGLTSEELET